MTQIVEEEKSDSGRAPPGCGLGVVGYGTGQRLAIASSSTPRCVFPSHLSWSCIPLPSASLPQIRCAIAWRGKEVGVEAVSSPGRKGRVKASDMGWSFLHASEMKCVAGRYPV